MAEGDVKDMAQTNPAAASVGFWASQYLLVCAERDIALRDKRDLLAVCKKLMEHMWSEFSPSGGEWATSVKADAEAAEAAIAKAEGSR